jgi:hypothetical protein
MRRYVSMRPEDLSGGIPAGEERIPEVWVGRRVEAVVVRPVNPDQPAYSSSLTALSYEGLLEEVSELGIVASLSSEAEMLAASTFYPWGAVLSMRLIQEP